MKRTIIQLDDKTYRKLHERAVRQKQSISSVVREIVAKGLEDETARHKPSRLSQFASVRAGRSKQRKRAPVSEKHDEALAAVVK